MFTVPAWLHIAYKSYRTEPVGTNIDPELYSNINTMSYLIQGSELYCVRIPDVQFME